MDRPVQVYVLSDDPRDRAAWVSALAGLSTLQIVGVGPIGAFELDGDGASVVLVIGADGTSMDAGEVGQELAQFAAPVVMLVDVDAQVDVQRMPDPTLFEAPDGPVVARISAESSPERVAAAVVALGYGLEVLDPLLADPWSPEDTYFDIDDTTLASSVGTHAVPSASDLSAGDPEPLTGRERDVLEELVNGSTNRQIAEALGIAENTVKFHVASLLSKFGASTRTDLVVRAIQAGTLRV